MARRNLLGSYDDETRVASRTRNTTGAVASRTRNARQAIKEVVGPAPKPSEYYSKDAEGFITIPKVNISRGNRKQIRAISDAYFKEQGIGGLNEYMKQTYGKSFSSKSDRVRYEMAYESILKGNKVYNEEIQKSVDQRNKELKAELGRKAGGAELEAGRMGKDLTASRTGGRGSRTALGRMGGVKGVLGMVFQQGGKALQKSDQPGAKQIGANLLGMAKNVSKTGTFGKATTKKAAKPAKEAALRPGRLYGKETLLGSSSEGRARRNEALTNPGASRENREYTPFGKQKKVARNLLGAK